MNRTNFEFINKIKNYFKLLPFEIKGKNLCVCLSGGADSVSLLRAMIFLREKLDVQVTACHFNHMIRGSEADRDEAFCKALCEEFGVKLYCGRDDVPLYAKTEKMSLEEAARECRYAFFKRISEKNNIDYCLTAHNMNDDAETLLFNIIRGSGSNGATSIATFKDTILRPMLKVTREEIENFLDNLLQEYVTDSTNVSVEYSRNYIRHILLPEISKLNPSAVQALSRFSDSCRADKEYFDEIVSQNIDSDLRRLPKAIRNRVIIRKFKDFSSKNLNHDMINAIDSLIFEDNRTILPVFSDYEAIINKGKLEFRYKTDTLESDFEPIDLTLGFNSIFNGRIDIIVDKQANNEIVDRLFLIQKICCDNIVGNLKVRNRRIGDKLTIFGINKSLKKLFIDKKVPKEYRNLIPVIFDDIGIIYVPFVGVADRVYSKGSENTILINTVFNTIEKERWNSAYEK